MKGKRFADIDEVKKKKRQRRCQASQKINSNSVLNCGIKD